MKDHTHSLPTEAVLHYLPADIHVLKRGNFVRCAVTGQAINVQNLCYWNVDRQEPYASPEAILKYLEK
jgi:hypothetical protein